MSNFVVMKLPFQPKAFLFDMDGTLYDSMPNHASSWYQMVCELGIECTPEEFYLLEGATGAYTVNLLFQRAYGREASAEEVQRLYERKAEIFRTKPQPRVMPGARQLVEQVMNLPWHPQTILVTGSGQGSLLQKLDADFPGAFPEERRVTALNVKRSKPAPDPFMQGAAVAGVNAAECVAVENAPLGVQSAHAAGCFTVAVNTGPIPIERLIEAGADLAFPSMLDCASILLN